MGEAEKPRERLKHGKNQKDQSRPSRIPERGGGQRGGNRSRHRSDHCRDRHAAAAQEQVAQRNATAQPNPATLAADTGIRPVVSSRIVEKPGSDFMVDVLKTLDLEYVAANPGSTFEGLHESLINYGDNKMPELLTCCHEESAVAMAHGYAKIEGKPMMALIHGTIGCSMPRWRSITPMPTVSRSIWWLATTRMARNAPAAFSRCTARRIWAVWCAITSSGTISRIRSGHFAESAVRAYNIARTPPMGPTLITMNAELQLHPNTQTWPAHSETQPDISRRRAIPPRWRKPRACW